MGMSAVKVLGLLGFTYVLLWLAALVWYVVEG
jgi:hypothetical protein